MCAVIVALFIFMDDVGGWWDHFCSSAMVLLSHICGSLCLLGRAVDFLIQCCCMRLCNRLSSYCCNFSKKVSLSSELHTVKLLLHWCFICAGNSTCNIILLWTPSCLSGGGSVVVIFDGGSGCSGGWGMTYLATLLCGIVIAYLSLLICWGLEVLFL